MGSFDSSFLLFSCLFSSQIHNITYWKHTGTVWFTFSISLSYQANFGTIILEHYTAWRNWCNFFFAEMTRALCTCVLVHLYTCALVYFATLQALIIKVPFKRCANVRLCNCATVQLCNRSILQLCDCATPRLFNCAIVLGPFLAGAKIGACRSALVRIQSVQKSKLASWHRLADPFLVKPENTWWFSHTPYFRDGWVWSPAVKRESLSPI